MNNTIINNINTDRRREEVTLLLFIYLTNLCFQTGVLEKYRYFSFIYSWSTYQANSKLAPTRMLLAGYPQTFTNPFIELSNQ